MSSSAQSPPTRPEAPGSGAPGRAPELDPAGRYVFRAGDLLLEIDPTLGARVTRFARGGRELLTPASTVAGGDENARNLFGSTFWPAPQSDWGWPPEPALDGDRYAVELTGASLVLRSEPGHITGLAAEKRVTLLEDRAVIEYVLVNRGAAARAAAPWEVTRAAKGGAIVFAAASAALPQSTLDSTWRDGVAWVDLSDPPAQDGKLFQDASEGWLAHVLDGVAFIKTFPLVPRELQAPGEAVVEIYVSGGYDYIEIEEQGAYEPIASGASSPAWRVEWRARRLPAGLDASVGSAELLDWLRRQMTTESGEP